VKPPEEAVLGAPKEGVKPVEAAEVLGAPKEGVKPVEAAVDFEASAPLVAPNVGVALGAAEPVDALKGVNPAALGLGADGPTDALKEGVKPVLGAAAFGCSDAFFSGVAPLLIAFEKRFEVAVAGGAALGAVVGACDDFGVGVEGSAGRERLDDSSDVSSLTLRLVDKADSKPVTPFAAARCFFASSILIFRARDCVWCQIDRFDQSANAGTLLIISRYFKFICWSCVAS
jgi:hypothetical protein